MTNPPPPKKQDVLTVRYTDGACHGLQFVRQTELAMAYRARDDGPATSLALDLTTGVITEAATLIADREGKLGCSDAVETLVAHNEPSQAGRTPGLLARSLRAAVSESIEDGA